MKILSVISSRQSSGELSLGDFTKASFRCFGECFRSALVSGCCPSEGVSGRTPSGERCEPGQITSRGSSLGAGRARGTASGRVGSHPLTPFTALWRVARQRGERIEALRMLIRMSPFRYELSSQSLAPEFYSVRGCLTKTSQALRDRKAEHFTDVARKFGFSVAESL